MRLLNRRFIAFYFDLSTNGAAGDADARAFVSAARPDLAESRVPTPPALVMTAEGKVVAAIDPNTDPDTLFAGLVKALHDHPECAAATEAERRLTDPCARAEVAIDLGQYEEARALLKTSDTAEGHYLLGHIARLQHDWQAMDEQLEQVAVEELADDVAMERAHHSWEIGEFAELRDRLRDVPRASNRYSEARYHLGLAHYHLGEHDEAIAIWRDMIKSCAQGPWVYRADWAYTNLVDKGGQLTMSANQPKASLLNRIGYLGKRNPDLAPRQ